MPDLSLEAFNALLESDVAGREVAVGDTQLIVHENFRVVLVVTYCMTE